MRGLGMKADKLEVFVEKKALDDFDATVEMWIVVADDALKDLDDTTEVTGFSDMDAAIRFARACANSNVNYRVLRVTDQVLVVGTLNSL